MLHARKRTAAGSSRRSAEKVEVGALWCHPFWVLGVVAVWCRRWLYVLLGHGYGSGDGGMPVEEVNTGCFGLGPDTVDAVVELLKIGADSEG